LLVRNNKELFYAVGVRESNQLLYLLQLVLAYRFACCCYSKYY